MSWNNYDVHKSYELKQKNKTTSSGLWISLARADLNAEASALKLRMSLKHPKNDHKTFPLVLQQLDSPRKFLFQHNCFEQIRIQRNHFNYTGLDSCKEACMSFVATTAASTKSDYCYFKNFKTTVKASLHKISGFDHRYKPDKTTETIKWWKNLREKWSLSTWFDTDIWKINLDEKQTDRTRSKLGCEGSSSSSKSTGVGIK